MQGCECGKGGWVSLRWGYGIFGQGEQGIWVGMGRMGISSQGHAYRVSKWIKMVRLELGTEKVIETKQGSLGTGMGWGEVKVRVLVQGCTECNKYIAYMSDLLKAWLNHGGVFMLPDFSCMWTGIWPRNCTFNIVYYFSRHKKTHWVL